MLRVFLHMVCDSMTSSCIYVHHCLRNPSLDGISINLYPPDPFLQTVVPFIFL